MKTYKKTALILLLLLLTLTAYSCKSDPSQAEKTVVNLKYKLAEDEELEPFYVSDTKIYAVVLKKDPPSTFVSRFGVTTEKFIVYNRAEEKTEAEYKPEDKEVYIYHAMPFEEGVIYAAYTLPTSKDDEKIRWEVKYVSDKESKVIDSGYCSDPEFTPGFAVVNESVHYLYEDFDKETGYGFGINKADLNKPEPIVEEKGRKLSSTEFYSNGTDYVVSVDGELGDGKDNMLFGNSEGLYGGYDLPEQMSDYGICGDYMFCCTTTDGKKWTARSVSLKTGKEYTAESEQPLYRIGSMSGDELTCVTENWEICIFRPGKNFEIFPLESSSEELLESRDFVAYYPYGDTKTLAQLDETKFYQITW